MKKILSFWLRFVAFTVGLLILINYALYVLVPKKDYGICVITNFYNQPENSIDVLVMGTGIFAAADPVAVVRGICGAEAAE